MAIIKVNGDKAKMFDNKTLYPSAENKYRVLDTLENKAIAEADGDIEIVEAFTSADGEAKATEQKDETPTE